MQNSHMDHGRRKPVTSDAMGVNPLHAPWQTQTRRQQRDGCKPIACTEADANPSPVARWMQTHCTHRDGCKPITCAAVDAIPSLVTQRMQTDHTLAMGLQPRRCKRIDANPSHDGCKPIISDTTGANPLHAPQQTQTRPMHRGGYKPINDDAMDPNALHAPWRIPTCHKGCDRCNPIACTAADANPSPVTRWWQTHPGRCKPTDGYLHGPSQEHLPDMGQHGGPKGSGEGEAAFPISPCPGRSFGKG